MCTLSCCCAAGHLGSAVSQRRGFRHVFLIQSTAPEENVYLGASADSLRLEANLGILLTAAAHISPCPAGRGEEGGGEGSDRNVSNYQSAELFGIRAAGVLPSLEWFGHTGRS